MTRPSRARPVREARRDRADAGDRHHAERDAGDEHVEAAASRRAVRATQDAAAAIGRERGGERCERHAAASARDAIAAPRANRKCTGALSRSGMPIISPITQIDRGDPGLRRIVARSPDVVDVDRRQAGIGIGRRHEEEADQDQHPRQAGPGRKRAPVVAELPDEIEQQERHPAVEQRQPAQEQRAVLEHVVGHPDRRRAEEVRDEIDHPQHLRQHDADRAHRHQQRAFEPDADERQDQHDVAEIEKIGRAVIVPIDRNEHRHEGGIDELERERQARRGLRHRFIPRDVLINHIAGLWRSIYRGLDLVAEMCACLRRD